MLEGIVSANANPSARISVDLLKSMGEGVGSTKQICKGDFQGLVRWAFVNFDRNALRPKSGSVKKMINGHHNKTELIAGDL